MNFEVLGIVISLTYYKMIFKVLICHKHYLANIYLLLNVGLSQLINPYLEPLLSICGTSISVSCHLSISMVFFHRKVSVVGLTLSIPLIHLWSVVFSLYLTEFHFKVDIFLRVTKSRFIMKHDLSKRKKKKTTGIIN